MALLAAAALALFSSETQTSSTLGAATAAPSWGPVGAIYQQITRPGTAGRISAEAPLFAWATPGGQLTNLEALRGQPVVINFWATWCVPCREEMPALDRVAAARPDVVFLEIDLQENPEAVTAFFVRYGVTHLQPVLDPQGKTTTRYGVLSLPTTFFVNRDGVIQHI
jgi:cytochrome c biogenesis protein CcmG/thiol:disulfide interchange protein DsbE